MLDVRNIRDHGEHPEESGENVLSLGHPGNRLHVKWVQGEESGDKGALPEGFRHAVKDEKEQERAGEVEQKIGEMMPSGLQPEELHVYHVGDPGQGVPVRGLAGRECPGDPLHGEAALHVPVVGDVLRIIEIDEIAAHHLPEGRQTGDHEEQGDYDQALLR